jgi:hypothetical protein
VSSKGACVCAANQVHAAVNTHQRAMGTRRAIVRERLPTNAYATEGVRVTSGASGVGATGLSTFSD